MLVIARKEGRLGNRLFLSAHIIAFAIEHDLRVANPAFDEYAREFASTRHDPLCCYPPLRLPLWTTRWRDRYYAAVCRLSRVLDRHADLGAAFPRLQPVEHLLRWQFVAHGVAVPLHDPSYAAWLQGRGLRLLGGWLVRDYPALRRHADAIRAHFAPLPAHRLAVKRLMTDLRRGTDLVIGVHLRRGDYRQHLGGIYYYPLSRYRDTMAEVQALFPDARLHFLLCSDEVLDAAHFSPFRVSRASGHPVRDMYALARCDYIVGPPSTFSGWAAFHGNVPIHFLLAPHRPLVRADFRSYATYDFLPQLDRLLSGRT